MNLKKIVLCFIVAIFVFDFAFTVTGMDIIPIGNSVNVSSGIMAYEVNLISLSCTQSWSCDSWGGCNSSEKQVRTCTDAKDCGSTTTRPDLVQNCTLAEGGGGIAKFFTSYTNGTQEEVSLVGDIIKFELDQIRNVIFYSTIFIVIMILLGLFVTKTKDFNIRKFLKR